MTDQKTFKTGDKVREVGSLYNLRSGIVRGFNRAGQVFVDWHMVSDEKQIIHDSVRNPDQLEHRESF